MDVKNFIWKNIITRFGIPRAIVADNGTQFDSKLIKNFCAKFKIKNYFSTPSFPQSNGQAEASNKVILDGIKKKLQAAKRQVGRRITQCTLGISDYAEKINRGIPLCHG